MKSNFLIALTQLAAERNLDRDTILSAVEEALSSTFKKVRSNYVFQSPLTINFLSNLISIIFQENPLVF